MNICLLKCGEIYENLKDQFADYDQMFINVFNAYSPAISFNVFSVFKDEYPEDLAKYDGFLSSGSLSSVYDNEPWIRKYEKLVAELHQRKLKHVGICFGHQMIAQALGGKVEKAAQGWGMGIKSTTIDHYTSWMNHSSANNPLNLIVSHQDQVVILPEDSTVLAHNAHCPVSMFLVDEHTLGIQAHPEFSKDYSNASIQKRSNTVDGQIIKQALDSLTLPTNEDIVIHWIENFFKSESR